MKKCSIILFLFTVGSQLLFSQTVLKDTIKQSNRYYYGEGIAENETEASNSALARLTQHIAVTVSSTFQSDQFEDKNNYQQTVRQVVETYSVASLSNFHTLRNQQGSKIEIFHYIEKKEVEKIFHGRIQLVRNIIERAKEFEAELNLGNALKWYYFASILLNSVPAQFIEQEGKVLITEIPSRITKILQSVRLSLIEDRHVSEKERVLVFSVRSNDLPAQSIELLFWDGSGYGKMQAADGEASIQLYGSAIGMTKLDLQIKYSYDDCRDEIKEVGDLWNVVKKPSYKNTQQIDLVSKPAVKKSEPVKSKPMVIEKTGHFSMRLFSKEQAPVVETIRKEAGGVLDLLAERQVDAIKKFFTKDQFLQRKVLDILQYNNLTILDTLIDANINKTAMGWELRRIRTLAYYPTLRKQSLEYLILDFDTEGKLYDLNFGITDTLYRLFVEQASYGQDWGNRQVIIKFAERYRTAFLSRDINMLDSLFADEAVIIIGRELKKTKVKDIYGFTPSSTAQPDYSYTQYTKKQYLKNQNEVFKRQKDLYVGFSTFKINRKNDSAGTYGLSMRQHYNSTTYADEGYLFLLVDFNEDLPQIYVRTWQPHEWNDEALYKLSNFKLNR
ncbi:MAG: hypothetical protein V1799_19110 [bacterium]